MVCTCSVRGCKNIYRKGETYKFFRIPVNRPAELKKWLEGIGRPDWTPYKFARVCSRHFVDGQPTPANPYPTIRLTPRIRVLATASTRPAPPPPPPVPFRKVGIRVEFLPEDGVQQPKRPAVVPRIPAVSSSTRSNDIETEITTSKPDHAYQATTPRLFYRNGGITVKESKNSGISIKEEVPSPPPSPVPQNAAPVAPTAHVSAQTSTTIGGPAPGLAKPTKFTALVPARIMKVIPSQRPVRQQPIRVPAPTSSSLRAEVPVAQAAVQEPRNSTPVTSPAPSIQELQIVVEPQPQPPQPQPPQRSLPPPRYHDPTNPPSPDAERWKNLAELEKEREKRRSLSLIKERLRKKRAESNEDRKKRRLPPKFFKALQSFPASPPPALESETSATTSAIREDMYDLSYSESDSDEEQQQRNKKPPPFRYGKPQPQEEPERPKPSKVHRHAKVKDLDDNGRWKVLAKYIKRFRRERERRKRLEEQLAASKRTILEAKVEKNELKKQMHLGWHRFVDDDTATSSWTGFSTFKIMEKIYNDHVKAEAENLSLRGTGGACLRHRKRKLTAQDEFLLTMIQLRTKMTASRLGFIFGIKHQYARSILRVWVPFAKEKLKDHVSWV